MKLSVPFIVTNYMKFNSLFFNNELPHVNEIPIKEMRSKRSIARITSREKEILSFSFSKHFDFVDRKSAEEVVIHEMIHIWQALRGYGDTHGRSFKIKSMLIENESDYQITTRARENTVTKPKEIVDVVIVTCNRMWTKRLGQVLFKVFKPSQFNKVIELKAKHAGHRIIKTKIDQSTIRYSKNVESKRWYVANEDIQKLIGGES